MEFMSNKSIFIGLVGLILVGFIILSALKTARYSNVVVVVKMRGQAYVANVRYDNKYRVYCPAESPDDRVLMRLALYQGNLRAMDPPEFHVEEVLFGGTISLLGEPYTLPEFSDERLAA